MRWGFDKGCEGHFVTFLCTLYGWNFSFYNQLFVYFVEDKVFRTVKYKNGKEEEP